MRQHRRPFVWMAVSAVALLLVVLAVGLLAAPERFQLGRTAYERVELRVDPPGSGRADGAAFDVDTAGSPLVVWTRRRPDGTGMDFLARTHDPDGHPRGPARVVERDPAIHPAHDLITGANPHLARHALSIARLPDDGAVAAWTQPWPDGGTTIHVEWFDPNGHAHGERVQVSGRRSGVEPVVAATPDGRVVVAWMARRDRGPGHDVMVRAFGPDRLPMSDGLRANRGDDWTSHVAIDVNAHGSAAVVWNQFPDRRRAALTARMLDLAGHFSSEPTAVGGRDSESHALSGWSTARRVHLDDRGTIDIVWTGRGPRGKGVYLTRLRPASELLERVGLGLERFGHHVHDVVLDEPLVVERVAAPHLPPVAGSPAVPRRSNPARRTASGLGFEAFPFTGLTPPDPELAVGPEHLVGIVNMGIGAWERDGTFLWQEVLGKNGFWDEVGAVGLVFDPEALYDPSSDRFFVMASERADNRSYFCLGVSETSSATGDWHKYRIEVTSLAGGLIDSPNMAVDGEAVYLAADFAGPDRYLILMMDKASVIAGEEPTMRHLLRLGTHGFALPQKRTADEAPLFMVEPIETEPAFVLRLWAIRDPLGAPSLESTLMSVPTYFEPGNIVSRGTSTITLTFEGRLWSSMYRDGRIWVAHHISLATPDRRTIARWYEIDMNGWPESGVRPSLNQSGNIDPGGDAQTAFVAVGTDAEGTMLATFARAAPDEFFSIGRAHRFRDDPPGVLRQRLITPAASVEHVPLAFYPTVRRSAGANTSNRWGDYADVVPDPFEPGAFWIHHVYVPEEGPWSTWIEKVHLDPKGDPAPVDRTPLPFTLDIGPSPTEGPATFAFQLGATRDVRIDLFDVAGRRVRSLSAGVLGPGKHAVAWDGRADRGHRVGSGVYLVRLSSPTGLLGTGRLVVR